MKVEHGEEEGPIKPPVVCKHGPEWFRAKRRAGFDPSVKASPTDIVCPHCGMHKRRPTNIVAFPDRGYWQRLEARQGKPETSPSGPTAA